MYLEQMTINLQLCLRTLQVKQSHTLKRLLFCAQWLFDFPLWTRTQSPILDILINGVIFFSSMLLLMNAKLLQTECKTRELCNLFFFFWHRAAWSHSSLELWQAISGNLAPFLRIDLVCTCERGLRVRKQLSTNRRERTEWKDRKAGGRKVGLVLQPAFYTRLSFHLTVFTPVSVAIARLI